MTEKTRLLIPGNTYRYHLINTGQSSAKFGNCQVCDSHVSEVWHQVEERQYQPDPTEWLFLEANNITPNGFWTTYQCTDLFGHRDCLEKQQLEPKPTEATEENTEALAPVAEK